MDSDGRLERAGRKCGKAEGNGLSGAAHGDRSLHPPRADRKDYGTDCEIEVVEQEQATNVRIHVQLKGTERPLNADGSLSIEVSRSNLNYLLMHPHSFYTAYHIPTASLRICPAETVLRQDEHAGKNWTQQQSLTVKFTDDLTVERLVRLAALATSAARAARNRRVEQPRAAVEETVGLLARLRVDDRDVSDRHEFRSSDTWEAGLGCPRVVAPTLSKSPSCPPQGAPRLTGRAVKP